MINDCTPINNIIRNYSLLTDNQLEVNVSKGIEEAIIEKARRASIDKVYQMPDRTWTATTMGVIHNGFTGQEDAIAWVKSQNGTDEVREIYTISKDLLHMPFLQSQQGKAWQIAKHLHKLGYRKPKA